MRGRKQKPEGIKKLTGTLQKCRTKNIANEVVTKLPSAPQHFSKTGKKLWKDVGTQCLRLGIINVGNLSPLVAYCQEMANYLDLAEELSREGNISTVYTQFGSKEVANPKVKIASNALKNAMKIATEYGLTPASIGKVGANQEKDDDEYKKFKRNK